MRCIHCGAELEVGSVFCPYCGTQQSIPAANYPDSYADPAVSGYVDPTLCEDYTTSVSPKKPKHSKRKVILGTIAAVVAVVIIAALLTNCFGFYGPATRIVLAAKNTIKKGNFTIEISTDTDDKSVSQMDIDFKNRTLTYLTEGEYTNYYGEKCTRYQAVYDGQYVYGSIYENGDTYLWTRDISDELEDFFDEYEDAKDWDWEDLLDALDDILATDLDDYMDEDEFIKSCKQYFRKLNSNKWLKENAGYTKTRKNGITYFNFDPKPYNFLRASMECFEDAFEDNDDYDEAMDSLREDRKDLNSIDIEISVGIKGGKLAEISYEIDGEADVTMEIRDYGTTDIDENFIETLIQRAKPA